MMKILTELQLGLSYVKPDFTPAKLFREIETIRERVPLYEELPESTPESEAYTLIDRIKAFTEHEYEDYLSSLSFYEKNVFCRMLCLSIEDEEAGNKLGLLAKKVKGITFYRLLRAYIQFWPHNRLLQEAFCAAAGYVMLKNEAWKAKQGLGLSGGDDLLLLAEGEDPISYFTKQCSTGKASLIDYASKQELLTHAPLFHRVREQYFLFSRSETMALEREEYFSCLESAEYSMQITLLARFLAVHNYMNYPKKLTNMLISTYGSPDNSTVWEDAELHRLSSDKAAKDARLQGHDSSKADKDARLQKSETGTASKGAEDSKAKAVLKPLEKEADSLDCGLHTLVWWDRMRVLKEYLGRFSAKIELYSRFIRNMIDLTYDVENDAMLIHFADFVIVDVRSIQSFSWLCSSVFMSHKYHELMQTLKGGYVKESRHLPENVAEAKFYILSDLRAEAYRLSFIEIDRVYARALIQDLLGIE